MNPGSVLVLGGGPAGMSAALWLHNLGLDCQVLEATGRPGGMQNFNFLANEWVLGQPGMTGPLIAQQQNRHLDGLGVHVLTDARAEFIEASGPGFACRQGAATRHFDAVLIATGTRYRAEEVLRGVAGFATLPRGAVAYGPYAFSDLDALAGRRVLIIGGGDNAFENARRLAAAGATPLLAVRSRSRAQRGLSEAVRELTGSARCSIFEPARLVGLAAGDGGIDVTLEVNGKAQSLQVDRLHVLTGYEPNTAFIGTVFRAEMAAAIALDAQGYVKTDAACRTGQRGIYAAGDVANPAFPCVVSAIAQGALAAKTIEHDLREGRP